MPFSLSPLWSRRGSLDDEVLLQPGGMYADSASLWVVDFSPARVIRFETTRGDIVHLYGKTGRGPGEWIGPLALVGRRGGEIGVFDTELRRVSWVSARNSPMQQGLLNAGPGMGPSCALDDGAMLSSIIARPNNTKLVTVSGQSPPVVSASELPWILLRALPAVASQVRIQAIENGCLVFPLYASGVARYDRTGKLTDTVHLVESAPNAVVEERQVPQGRAFSVAKGSVHGVNGAVRFGPYLVVAFGGRTSHRERLLDFYDWKTTQYVGSVRSPMEINRIAATTSTLFVQMLDDEGLYLLQALRFSRTAPRH